MSLYSAVIVVVPSATASKVNADLSFSSCTIVKTESSADVIVKSETSAEEGS